MQQYRETDYKNVQYKIEKLDRQIIFRLVRRFRDRAIAQRIKSANNYSNSAGDFKLMLEQGKLWGISAGLNSNIVYKLWQYLIDYYLT